MFANVCLTVTCLFADVTSANITGYAAPPSNEGTYACMFRAVNGETTRLGRIAHAHCEGVTLSFADEDGGWRSVESRECDDGEFHWFDRKDDSPADDCEIRQGQALGYVIPEGQDNALTFDGEVNESYLESNVASMFSDRVTLGDLKMSRKDLERIVGPLRVVVTNNVKTVVQPPSRFVIVYKDGRVVPASVDLSTMKISDPQTLRELVLMPEKIDWFGVETNGTVAASERMSEQQVEGLMKLVVALYKDRQDKEAQEKTQEAVTQAVLSWSAAWKWAIGIFCAPFVAKPGEYAARKVFGLFKGIWSRIKRFWSKRRGMRLYRNLDSGDS